MSPPMVHLLGPTCYHWQSSRQLDDEMQGAELLLLVGCGHILSEARGSSGRSETTAVAARLACWVEIRCPARLHDAHANTAPSRLRIFTQHGYARLYQEGVRTLRQPWADAHCHVCVERSHIEYIRRGTCSFSSLHCKLASACAPSTNTMMTNDARIRAQPAS